MTTNQKWQVKIPFAHGQCPERDPVVRAWHRIIRDRSLTDVLIDVADYTHVADGPGILLIGHAFEIRIDSEGGVAGLTVRRKRGGSSDPGIGLKQVVQRALEVAALLIEDADLDLSPASFATDRLLIIHNDRLLAPHDEATRERLGAVVATVLESMYGRAATKVEPLEGDGRLRLQFGVTATSAPGISELVERLGPEVPYAA